MKNTLVTLGLHLPQFMTEEGENQKLEIYDQFSEILPRTTRIRRLSCPSIPEIITQQQ